MLYLNRIRQCLLFILFISAFCSSIFAQNNFQPGFYIENNGDTINCEVNLQSNILLANSCRFRLPASNTIKEFAPFDILGFGFVNGKIYEAKEVLGRKLFLETLVKGRVSLYQQYIDNKPEFIIEKEGRPIAILLYEEGIKQDENGRQYFFKSKKHFGILQIFMSDGSEKIKRKILTITQPSRKNLSKLIEAYNSEFKTQDSALSYVSNHKNVEASLEPVFSSLFFNGSTPTYILGAGVLLNLTLEQNKRFQFKIGALYHIRKIHNDRRNIDYCLDITEFPLQIQYMYPLERIKPFASIGTGLIYIDIYEKGDKWSRPAYAKEHIRSYYANFGVGIATGITHRIEISTSVNYTLLGGSIFINTQIGLIYHFKN